MTQKWIAGFGTTVDLFTDYRRTGYPVMYDPNTDILVLGPADHETYTSTSRDYPKSLPWPDAEINLNLNAPSQKNISTDAARVFWDVN